MIDGDGKGPRDSDCWYRFETGSYDALLAPNEGGVGVGTSKETRLVEFELGFEDDALPAVPELLTEPPPVEFKFWLTLDLLELLDECMKVDFFVLIWIRQRSGFRIRKSRCRGLGKVVVVVGYAKIRYLLLSSGIRRAG